jgi:hypothetical protein
MDIKISYPQGSSGVWLACLLHYCTTPHTEWKYRDFYKYNQKIKIFHNIDLADNVLSIGNGDYKYNFWRIFAHHNVIRKLPYKRFSHQVSYKKFRHTRIVTSPYDNNIDIRNDFFWLVDQCRFIQDYKCPGKFQIDWQNLFYNPHQVWIGVCEFLENNQIKNHRNFDQFLTALENYRDTCKPIKFSINLRHKLFKVWALAFLQNNNYEAPDDVFYNFENHIINEWILDNKNLILDYTNSNCINIG